MGLKMPLMSTPEQQAFYFILLTPDNFYIISLFFRNFYIIFFPPNLTTFEGGLASYACLVVGLDY